MTPDQTEIQPAPPRRSVRDLVARARAYGRRHWQELVLLGVSLVMYATAALFIPFAFFRVSDGWIYETNRQDDPDRPLTLYEHYEQLGVDMNGFLNAGRNFPNVGAAKTFIYRPVYPALASIIPRIANIIEMWPNFREGLLAPASLRLTFLTMLLLNLIMYPGSVLLFHAWLKLHWSPSISLIAALIYALLPVWVAGAALPGTLVYGYVVIIASIYMFDRWLLADDQPTWKQIIVVGLIAGILILGKTEFEGLLAAWAWTVYKRRWRVLGATFVLTFLPQILWIGFLNVAHIEYYNADVEGFGYTRWIFQFIADGQWLNMYPYGMSIVSSYLMGFAGAYSLIVLIAAGWAFFAEEVGISTEQRYRAALTVLMIMGMAVLIGHQGFGARLAKSTFFVVLPLAASGMVALAALLTNTLNTGRDEVSGTLPLIIVGALVALSTLLHWSDSSILSNIITPRGFRWQPDFRLFNGLFERLLNLMVKTGPEY